MDSINKKNLNFYTYYHNTIFNANEFSGVGLLGHSLKGLSRLLLYTAIYINIRTLTFQSASEDSKITFSLFLLSGYKILPEFVYVLFEHNIFKFKWEKLLIKSYLKSSGRNYFIMHYIIRVGTK